MSANRRTPPKLTLVVTISFLEQEQRSCFEWGELEFSEQVLLNKYGLMQARLNSSGLHYIDWRSLHWCLAKLLCEDSACTCSASQSSQSCFSWHCVQKHFWLESHFSTVASENICITPRSPTRAEYLLKRKFVLKISVTFSNQHFSEIPLKQCGSLHHCKNSKPLCSNNYLLVKGCLWMHLESYLMLLYWHRHWYRCVVHLNHWQIKVGILQILLQIWTIMLTLQQQRIMLFFSLLTFCSPEPTLKNDREFHLVKTLFI